MDTENGQQPIVQNDRDDSRRESVDLGEHESKVWGYACVASGMLA